MYFIQIYNQYSWIKRMINVRLWIRICLLQLNYLFGVGIERKHIMGSRSEHRFPVRSRVPPKHINSREIGKTCQQKWNFQHQNHDDYDFLITYENETSSTTRLIILVFLNALEHQSSSSQNLTRKSSTVNKFLSSNVRTTYLQGG